MKKLLITLFSLIAVMASSFVIGCDMLATKPPVDDGNPDGPVTPPPAITDTIDINDVSSIYPGYFTYLEYTKGTDEGVTYVCPTGISVEDGKVIVEDGVEAGFYTISATKEDEVEEVNVEVKEVKFLNNNDNEGTGFIDRLNGTLSTIAGAGYDEDELVLFAGDSFMDDRWFFTDFYTRFAHQNAHIIGISSSLAEQWIWYGQYLIDYAPKAIVMHVGTNDIFDKGRSIIETTNILTEMFDAYHKYLPETDIYWLSIEPRLGRSNENGNGKAIEVNNAIIDYAEDKDWLIIADTATAFAQDAYDDPNDLSSIKYTASETTLYGDSVHPSCPVGYDKLMEVVYEAGLTISQLSTYIPPKDTIDIANVNVYPGYFTYLKYTKGNDVGVTYDCPTGISIEDGIVTVAENVLAGTYTISAIKEDEIQDFEITVNNIQNLKNRPGDSGTAFIDRFNSTLTTLESVSYDEGELVLFGGDSFMDERCFFTDFYNRFSYKNAHLIGISSSLAEQWIWYGQHLIEYAPKAIVLHVGTNDIFDGGKTAQQTTDILIEMFDAYHKYMPETDIYWWNIEPRLGSARAGGNAKAVEVNTNILSYAQGKDWFKYLDSATPFSKDAYVNVNDLSTIKSSASETTLYGDTIHPSCPAGYDKLMELAYSAGLTISDLTEFKQTFADKTMTTADKMSTSIGVNLGKDILFRTTVTINEWLTNAHITLHFNEHSANAKRFLIWDNDSNGTFRYTIAYVDSKDVFDATGDDKSFDLAILVKGKDAYLFADGLLRCAYLNIPLDTLTTLYYGSESMNVSFTSTTVVDLSNADATTYLEAIAEYDALTGTSETKIVDIKPASESLDFETTTSDSFNSSKDVARGTHYVFETTVTINHSTNSNAHITINFNRNSNTRFLIWKHASGDDTFYFVPWTDSYNGWSNRGKVQDGMKLPAGATFTLAVLVTNDSAYLFIDGKLRIAWLNTMTQETGLSIGTEAMSASFTNCAVYDANEDVYSQLAGKVNYYESLEGNASTTFADLVNVRIELADFATTTSDTFGTSKDIATGINYVFETTVTAGDTSKGNAHITINFNRGSATRFLIWNHSGNGTFYFVPWTDSYNGWNKRGEVKDGIQLPTGTSFNLAVLVTGDNIYLFIDGELRICWLNYANQDTGLSIGTEAMSASFTNCAISNKGIPAYDKYLSKVTYYETLGVTISTTYADLVYAQNFAEEVSPFTTATSNGFDDSKDVATGTNYLYETKVTINHSTNSNAHITINFNRGSGTRFLIWNHSGNGTFHFVPWTESYNGWSNKNSIVDGMVLPAGTTFTISVLVTSDSAYLFIDGELRIAWLNSATISKGLSIGSESMSVEFSDCSISRIGTAEYSECFNKVIGYENSTDTTNVTYADLAK